MADVYCGVNPWVFSNPRVPEPYLRQSQRGWGLQTISLENACKRLVSTGIGKFAAARKIQALYSVDVTSLDWFSAMSEGITQVGGSDDGKLREEVLIKDSVVQDFHVQNRKGFGVVGGNKVDQSLASENVAKTAVLDFRIPEVVSIGMSENESAKEYSPEMDGYCYLHLYKFGLRQFFGKKHGAYPKLSQIITGVGMEVWDFRGLAKCGVQYMDDDGIHIHSDGDGEALDMLVKALTLGARKVGDGSGMVNYDLGGREKKIGSVGELSDKQVMAVLMKRRIEIPIVYATHISFGDQYDFSIRDLDNPVCEPGRLQQDGLREYTYSGHSQHSMVLLEPGQFVVLGDVKVGSASMQVGVVVPANKRLRLMQAESWSENMDHLDRPELMHVLDLRKPLGLRIRVILLSEGWDKSYMALPDQLSDARLAASHSQAYLHCAPRVQGIFPLLHSNDIEVTDPFDDNAALADVRHTVEHEGSMAVSLSLKHIMGVVILDQFRSRNAISQAYVVSQVMEMLSEDASVSVNMQLVQLTLSVDKVLEKWQDDFSFHSKRIHDEYTFDDGGPSDDEGFPPAFFDRGVSYSSLLESNTENISLYD